MPVYEFACYDCGGYTTRYRSIANRNDAPQCECGQTMKKAILTAPHGSVQAEAHYLCPVTGQEVTSWAQRRNIFAKYDLIDANEVGKDTFKEERLKKKAKREELAKEYLPPDLMNKLKQIGQGNSDPKDNFRVT